MHIYYYPGYILLSPATRADKATGIQKRSSTLGQDGGVGKCHAHFLPQLHQNYK